MQAILLQEAIKVREASGRQFLINSNTQSQNKLLSTSLNPTIKRDISVMATTNPQVISLVPPASRRLSKIFDLPLEGWRHLSNLWD
jgi:hypothetical protein